MKTKTYPWSVTNLSPATIQEKLATLCLLRHPDAGKATVGTSDYNREWSEEGKKQAATTVESYGTVIFNKFFSSGVPRADKLIRQISVTKQKNFKRLPILGFAENPKDATNIIFTELGQKPLRVWFDHPMGNYIVGYGFLALNELLANIKGRNQRVLVGGHAVNHAAILLAIGMLFKHEPTIVLAQMSFLKGAEAFVISFESSGITSQHLECRSWNQ